MNAAHDLARQHVPCRDHKLKRRESDAYRIGQTSPAARAEPFRESVLEIIEFDLDRRFTVYSLQHLLPSSAHNSHGSTSSRRLPDRSGGWPRVCSRYFMTPFSL